MSELTLNSPDAMCLYAFDNFMNKAAESFTIANAIDNLITSVNGSSLEAAPAAVSKVGGAFKAVIEKIKEFFKNLYNAIMSLINSKKIDSISNKAKSLTEKYGYDKIFKSNVVQELMNDENSGLKSATTQMISSLSQNAEGGDMSPAKDFISVINTGNPNQNMNDPVGFAYKVLGMLQSTEAKRNLYDVYKNRLKECKEGMKASGKNKEEVDQWKKRMAYNRTYITIINKFVSYSNTLVNLVAKKVSTGNNKAGESFVLENDMLNYAASNFTRRAVEDATMANIMISMVDNVKKGKKTISFESLGIIGSEAAGVKVVETIKAAWNKIISFFQNIIEAIKKHILSKRISSMVRKYNRVIEILNSNEKRSGDSLVNVVRSLYNESSSIKNAIDSLNEYNVDDTAGTLTNTQSKFSDNAYGKFLMFKRVKFGQGTNILKILKEFVGKNVSLESKCKFIKKYFSNETSAKEIYRMYDVMIDSCRKEIQFAKDQVKNKANDQEQDKAYLDEARENMKIAKSMLVIVNKMISTINAILSAAMSYKNK